MPKSSRLRRGDPFWRDTIAAWNESGLSLTAFCAERGIAQSTFFSKRAGVNPWSYLRDVLSRLAEKAAEVSELFPDVWAKQHNSTHS